MGKISKLTNMLFSGFGIQVIQKRSRNFDAIYKDIYASLGKSPELILDVGAHNGSSIERYKKIWPKVGIHSFEPNSLLFEEMQDKFRGSTSVKLIKCGISNYSGMASFNIHTTSTGSSSVLDVDRGTNFSKRRGIEESNVQRVEIAVDTLDNYIESSGLQIIDLLKVDVQGLEFEVFQGCHQSFLNSKIEFVEVELIVADLYSHDKKWSDTVKLLGDNGFSVIAISTDARSTNLGPFDLVKNRELQFDFLFGRNDIVKNLCTPTE
jgi:FkbM family methyltransferase